MEKQTLRPSPDALLNPRYDANFKAIFSEDSDDGRTLSGRMAVVFVELPKYKDGDEKTENLTAVEKWCKFLLYADDSAKRSLVGEICKSDGGIMAASGILTKISQDDINWARQTSIDIRERDQLTTENHMKELKQELAESHAVIEEKDAALAEKDAKLLALLREIELLRAKLANKNASEKL